MAHEDRERLGVDACGDRERSVDVAGLVQVQAVEPPADLSAAINAEFNVVAVTDHDSAALIADIQKDERVSGNEIVVLPGVELTSVEGVHLLALLELSRTTGASAQ